MQPREQVVFYKKLKKISCEYDQIVLTKQSLFFFFRFPDRGGTRVSSAVFFLVVWKQTLQHRVSISLGLRGLTFPAGKKKRKTLTVRQEHIKHVCKISGSISQKRRGQLDLGAVNAQK